MDERFVDIEMKLAHQEETIHQLNEMIYQQQKQIDKLEVSTKHLMGRIHSISEGLSGDDGDNVEPPPPHY